VERFLHYQKTAIAPIESVDAISVFAGVYDNVRTTRNPIPLEIHYKTGEFVRPFRLTHDLAGGVLRKRCEIRVKVESENSDVSAEIQAEGFQNFGCITRPCVEHPGRGFGSHRPFEFHEKYEQLAQIYRQRPTPAPALMTQFAPDLSR
jgi:hypothetical protein